MLHGEGGLTVAAAHSCPQAARAARARWRNSRVLELTVLGDHLTDPGEELQGFSVVRCWGFNRLGNPLTLIRAIKQLQPDVVWLQPRFRQFWWQTSSGVLWADDAGSDALCALATPTSPCTSCLRPWNLSDAGVKSPVLYTLAGRVATHFLLSANSLSVLLPAYHKTLREKYQRDGSTSGITEFSPAVRSRRTLQLRGNPVHRILAFGKWVHV